MRFLKNLTLLSCATCLLAGFAHIEQSIEQSEENHFVRASRNLTITLGWLKTLRDASQEKMRRQCEQEVKKIRERMWSVVDKHYPELNMGSVAFHVQVDAVYEAVPISVDDTALTGFLCKAQVSLGSSEHVFVETTSEAHEHLELCKQVELRNQIRRPSLFHQHIESGSSLVGQDWCHVRKFEIIRGHP
ncbi:MAG: hypothetical protein AB1540_08020 [Bdellovibrionota bacterium]